MSVAELLRAKRIERSISQEAAAKELHVTQQTVGRWERDESVPEPDNLPQLAKFLGVPVAELRRLRSERDAEIAAANFARHNAWPLEERILQLEMQLGVLTGQMAHLTQEVRVALSERRSTPEE